MAGRELDGNQAGAAGTPASSDGARGRELPGFPARYPPSQMTLPGSCQSAATATRMKSCLTVGRVITYPVLLLSHNANAVAAPVLGRVGKTALQA